MDSGTKQTLLTGAMAAAGLYLVWKWLNKGKDQAVDSIAQWWVRLTSDPPVQVPGNVVFPNGAKVPIQGLPIKHDTPNGVYTVYTQYQGTVYQLQPSNADGDWPAVQVG